jgi:hypothetical protein
MSEAAVIPFPNQFALGWRETRDAVREGHALGARFRVAGAGIVIEETAGELPATLRKKLGATAEDGRLFQFFRLEDIDNESLAYAERHFPDVVLTVVSTRAEARIAVKKLLEDIRLKGGHLALDIETYPVEGPPRPPIQLNKDGGLSARAAKWENDAGLDPRRSQIGALQLYAGGVVCFLFRTEALRLVRDSHWLRRQHLVAHNALFELSFLKLHSRPSMHRRRAVGRPDCSLQGGGLVNGTDARVPERGRSLARVVAVKLELPELPKGLQTSDWGAERLTRGQVAYACLDAITTWHLWPNLKVELERQGSWEAY